MSELKLFEFDGYSILFFGLSSLFGCRSSILSFQRRVDMVRIKHVKGIWWIKGEIGQLNTCPLVGQPHLVTVNNNRQSITCFVGDTNAISGSFSLSWKCFTATTDAVRSHQLTENSPGQTSHLYHCPFFSLTLAVYRPSALYPRFSFQKKKKK